MFPFQIDQQEAESNSGWFWLVGPVKACVWGVGQDELTWVLTFPGVPCVIYSACQYLAFVVFRFCAVVCFERISEKLGSEKCGTCTDGPGKEVRWRVWNWFVMSKEVLGPATPHASVRFDGRCVLFLRCSLSALTACGQQTGGNGTKQEGLPPSSGFHGSCG